MDCKLLVEDSEGSPLVGSVLVCMLMMFTVRLLGAYSDVARNRSVFKRFLRNALGSGILENWIPINFEARAVIRREGAGKHV